VSDDYAMTRAVRDAGGTIRFEPRCLMASQGAVGFLDFIRWANRQIIITRVYHARYWRIGIASYGLYAVTFLWGLSLILLPGSAAGRLAATGFLGAIMSLGIAKGALRTRVAREVFGSAALGDYGSSYWQFTPLVPWVMLFNFMVAGFIHRIEWRGTTYELKSMTELKVIGRET
jgi:hypothetical protein